MTRTAIHYEKWLWGDNSTDIQGRIIVLWLCPSSHCHLSPSFISMPTVVLKLFAGQGTRRTDRQKKWQFWGHNKVVEKN